MIVTAGAFVEQVAKSRILPPARLNAFAASPQAQSLVSSTELAMLAVREQLLTRFQAEEILNGRGRQLRVNDYVLVEILGYGGMGTVYIARHPDKPTCYALKLLGKQYKHEAGIRARFRLEARAGMRFDHPRLVKTYDVGRVEHLYGETDYMVMELFQGVTLLEGISFSAGPMKWDAACDVVSQAAEGISYLHHQGMVHRDVKPDNILIDVQGNAKLLDFGLTLADQACLDEEFSLAMIFGHDCLGTADFIPPEQSLDSMKVDGRADIYSLGCTLYVALTAQRPFPRPNRAETVRAHRTDPRPRADRANPQCPKELADIVERMMAVDPAGRPATAAEVIQLLQPFCRRRNWAFEFQQVLIRRREIRRASASKCQAGSATQVTRQTKLNAHQETDSTGKLSREEPTA
ncbi:serine/threonine protein kinase [Planctomicrobium sp. SH664]|uniref:serine/threonine protein kinase n=1 Tax=Planctomicrobium sp. SH664 TaxID=3448125 RepID=UPI003F5B0276